MTVATFATTAPNVLFDQYHVKTDFVVQPAWVYVSGGAIKDKHRIGAIGACAAELRVLARLDLYELYEAALRLYSQFRNDDRIRRVVAEDDYVCHVVAVVGMEELG